MTPVEHLELIVRPNMVALEASHNDIRLAFNAAASLDGLVANMYWWGRDNAPDRVPSPKNLDDGYRHELFARCRDLRLALEVARANKHARLERGDPVIIGSVVRKAIDWDDIAVFDDCPEVGADHHVVIAVTDHQNYEMAVAVFRRALEFLENEMARLGIRAARN